MNITSVSVVEREFFGPELHVYTDAKLPTIDVNCIRTTEKGRRFWYGESGGFVRYFTNGVATLGHSTEYHWSSRASVFNTFFGTECKEVVVHEAGHRCPIASAMTVDKILEILPEGWTLEKTIVRNEVCYELVKS